MLADARRLEPDIVLMDIKMPPTHSMEGIEAAHASAPGTALSLVDLRDLVISPGDEVE